MTPQHPDRVAADGAAPQPSAEEQLAFVASPDMLAMLRRHLRSSYRSLSDQDTEDIAGDVITQLIDRLRAGRWQPEPNQRMLERYVRKAADWAALDFFRSAVRKHETPVSQELLHDAVLSDDEAVAALDRSVTADGVRAALRKIQADSDHTAFAVVTYLLDEIQRTGERPSNRRTAAVCGVSHTAVAKALERIRPYFAEARRSAQAD